MIQGWLRMADGREPDPLMLLLAVDTLPPVTFDMGLAGWAPTLELSAHVRAVPAPGWLRVRVSTRNFAGGLLEEDAEVWDSPGPAGGAVPAARPGPRRVRLSAASRIRSNRAPVEREHEPAAGVLRHGPQLGRATASSVMSSGPGGSSVGTCRSAPGGPTQMLPIPRVPSLVMTCSRPSTDDRALHPSTPPGSRSGGRHAPAGSVARQAAVGSRA